jgi:branched-chain amino acid transport system permease protein
VNRRLTALAVFGLGLLLIALPLLMPRLKLDISLGVTVLLFGLAAASVNLLVGYTRIMAFGNAAFFGLGAYGAALFIQFVVPNFWLAIVVGSLAGLIGALVLAPFLIRRRGIYFALLTIAFGQVFYFIAYRMTNVTGGEDGMTVTRPALRLGAWNLGSHESAFYYFVLVMFFVVMLGLWYVVHSPFGRTLVAIGQNEVRARYLGLNSDRFIFQALVISGFVAGIAGALYSMSIEFAYPLMLDWHQSGDFVMMVILGGSGTFWGPLLGSAIYVIGQNVLSSWTHAWQIIIGGLFVACVLLFPRGILGLSLRPRGAGVAREEDVYDEPVPQSAAAEAEAP